MQSKLFKVDELPDINDSFTEKNIESNINNIYMNYEYLIKDTLKIIELSLEEGIRKPLLMYNLFFGVELFLKFYLIRFSKLRLEVIENKGHNIFELIKLINNIDEKSRFKELEYLLQSFRTKKDTKLEIQKYHNYKYNHEKGKQTLIFDFEINENEKNRIKEVMEWINSYMQTL